MKTYGNLSVRVIHRVTPREKLHIMRVALSSKIAAIMLGVFLTVTVLSSTFTLILTAKESEPVEEPKAVDLGYDDAVAIAAVEEEERTPQEGEDSNLEIVLNEPYLLEYAWNDTSTIADLLTELENEQVVEEVVEEPAPVRYEITSEEYDILCRVVEAEVEGYDVWVSRGLNHEQIINAKTRVAQVFLNRVESSRFDVSTLKSALLQNNATSTIKDGRYYSTTVTEYTREAVDKALSAYTPDLTMGALFFSSGNSGNGTAIFTDEVGHTFSK